MPRFGPHPWCNGDQPRRRHLDLDLAVDFTPAPSRAVCLSASTGPVKAPSTSTVAIIAQWWASWKEWGEIRLVPVPIWSSLRRCRPATCMNLPHAEIPP